MVVIRFYQHSLLSKESFDNKSAFIFPISATLSFTSLSEQPKTIEKGWRSIRNGFVEEKRCQRHTGPRGWVECSHQSNCCYHKYLHQFFIKIQYQDLDQTSTSIYWQKICFKIQIKLQPQNLVQLNFNQSTSRVERLFTSVRQMRSIKLGWGNELYFHQFQTRPTSGAIFVVDSFCTSLVSGTTSQLDLCSSIEVLSSTARVTSVKFTK